MPFREGVSASRRFHVTLPSDLEREVSGHARRLGLRVGPAIRSLVALGLAGSDRRDDPALLATLTAAEHALLIVASILPEGERRISALAERATQAAEERLQLFRGHADAGEDLR